MKKLILTALLVFPQHMNAGIKTIGFASIGAIGIYFITRWFRQPGTIKPTIENMNTVTIRQTSHTEDPVVDIDNLVRAIHKNKKVPYESATIKHHTNLYSIKSGIAIDHNDHEVCLFSRGYAKVESIDSSSVKDFYDLTQYGGGAKGALIQCIDNIAPHTPIIGFDYKDDRRHFSMGAHKELESLDVIMNGIKEKNPNASIIVVADCRGAGTALRYAAQYQPHNIKAMVLMAPFVSGRELSDQVAQNYLGSVPLSKQLLDIFFKAYYPCYKPEKEHDNVYDLLQNTPNIPIFLAYRKKDTLISPNMRTKLRTTLQEAGNQSVHVCELEDQSAPHSKLTHLPELQQQINQFYKQYGITTTHSAHVNKKTDTAHQQ